MANKVVFGNYGFSTVYEDFTNQQPGRRNFRVVKILVSAKTGEEIERTNEVISVDNGQTVTLYQNISNGVSVTFKLFRRDYNIDGTFTEVKCWEKETPAQFAPLGPR